ncbi:MAG: hypothetical protein JWM07_464 [Candidatus Saccharibacteria bacterium]|jgi:hypothetical protein|nr:hypothetical protein [Candidatus Saccharibacteria bacterium]
MLVEWLRRTFIKNGIVDNISKMFNKKDHPSFTQTQISDELADKILRNAIARSQNIPRGARFFVDENDKHLRNDTHILKVVLSLMRKLDQRKLHHQDILFIGSYNNRFTFMKKI